MTPPNYFQTASAGGPGLGYSLVLPPPGAGHSHHPDAGPHRAQLHLPVPHPHGAPRGLWSPGPSPEHSLAPQGAPWGQQVRDNRDYPGSRVEFSTSRYCLDKNYGGWLSVWDRLFGTFQEEKHGEDIVYGLVDQPQFFNVIRHQLFYFPLLANKTSPQKGFSSADHIKKWLYGPGWFPNLNLPRY